METQIGKTTGVHKPRKRITISSREEYNKKLRGNDLEFSFVSLTAAEFSELSLSLALTLTTITEATTSRKLSYNDAPFPSLRNMIALGTYILVHSFRLFTSIAHRGIFRLFTNIVFLVGSLYDFGFGLGQ